MPTVTITIKDDKGRPVALCPVTLGPIKSFTNASGIAVINLPTSGQVRLTATHALYAPYATTVNIPPLQHEIVLTGARF